MSLPLWLKTHRARHCEHVIRGRSAVSHVGGRRETWGLGRRDSVKVLASGC